MEFWVIGYVFFEGNYSCNMKLFENCVLVFVGYLQNYGGVDEFLLIVDWKGEDWFGLCCEVVVLSLIDKGVIFVVIDGYMDFVI